MSKRVAQAMFAVADQHLVDVTRATPDVLADLLAKRSVSDVDVDPALERLRALAQRIEQIRRFARCASPASPDYSAVAGLWKRGS